MSSATTATTTSAGDMPYISQKRRREILDRAGVVWKVVREKEATPGDLNYIITVLLSHYVDGRDMNYKTLNEVVGVLESAKMEFYRKVVVPYEENKLKENGDIYSAVTERIGNGS